LLDLLERKMKLLHLNPEHKEILRNGLKEEKFSKKAKEVAEELRKKGKHEEAAKLVDMSPLFDPHDFWRNQPVPQANEKVD
jgi:hypothetical protein